MPDAPRDAARLFNAVVASGLRADYANYFETVTFLLSKGLGAPAGSLIVTDDPTILERLRRFRRMYGGAMRQSGILAAGTLRNGAPIPRLANDHAHAHDWRPGLHQEPGRHQPCRSGNDILFFGAAHDSRHRPSSRPARQEGVLLNAVNAKTCRAVTHLDVSTDAIDRAADAIARILA